MLMVVLFLLFGFYWLCDLLDASKKSARMSTPKPLSTSVEGEKLVLDMKDCIENITSIFSDSGSPINDTNQNCQQLCANLEQFLLLGFTEQSSLCCGKKLSYWDFLKATLISSKGGVDAAIRFANNNTEVRTSLGRGRAFLRYCLAHGCLADAIQQSLMAAETLATWYSEAAPMRNDTLAQMLVSVSKALADVNFDLSLGGHDLDREWPSFGPGPENQVHPRFAYGLRFLDSLNTKKASVLQSFDEDINSACRILAELRFKVITEVKAENKSVLGLLLDWLEALVAVADAENLRSKKHRALAEVISLCRVIVEFVYGNKSGCQSWNCLGKRTFYFCVYHETSAFCTICVAAQIDLRCQVEECQFPANALLRPAKGESSQAERTLSGSPQRKNAGEWKYFDLGEHLTDRLKDIKLADRSPKSALDDDNYGSDIARAIQLYLKSHVVQQDSLLSLLLDILKACGVNYIKTLSRLMYVSRSVVAVLENIGPFKCCSVDCLSKTSFAVKTNCAHQTRFCSLCFKIGGAALRCKEKGCSWTLAKGLLGPLEEWQP